MKKSPLLPRLLPLLLALAICGTTSAQETQWQPFGELSAGISTFKEVSLPTYSATFGLRHGDLTLGLRYRTTLPLFRGSTPQLFSLLSPCMRGSTPQGGGGMNEAEPIHDLSLLLQSSTALSPRFELFGGVATGFAIQHSQQLYNNPLGNSNTMALNAEVNLGIRYYVAENVALTFNVGAGIRMTGDDWRKLASKLPYDPRTIPTYTTAMGGVSIGIPPKAKKVNLPPQLIVDGKAPILTAYENDCL